MKQPTIDDPAQVTTWRLKNGLRVALLRDPRARLATVDLRFEVGTADDPPLRAGMALYVGEALVGAGLRRRPDVELTTQLAVDVDRTELTSSALDLDAALELAAHRLETSCDDFTPALLATARDRAQQQLTAIPPAFAQAVWGEGHPYAHELGTPELAAVPTAELCAFYTAHYAPSAATLVITGPVAADLPGTLEQRFGTVHDHALAPRGAITVITPTTQRMRHVVWGLGKPTAALAFQVPAQGDQDDLVPELAIRRIQQWAAEHKADLHAALVGGRRGRALVLAIEADSEAGLGRAHEKLRDILADANTVIEGDTSDATSDDQLLEAQALDDPFHRGAAIADLVASGRRVELLRRVRAFASSASPRSWIREHLTSSSAARTLDLIPAVPGQGGPIDGLTEPGAMVDRDLADLYVPATPDVAVADPAVGRLPPLDRSVEDYTLPNGLHVVLASDPIATTIDVRLVFPVGTHDDPAPGIALRAATELAVDDRVGADTAARDRLVWYGEKAVGHSDVDVSAATTRFRAVGFAALGDWHVFSVAWHVIRGSYEVARLEPFKRHYAPKGATLIVSGGFDRAALRPIIERWFGPWPTPKEPPPRAVPPTGPHHPVVYEPGDLQSVDLVLSYGPASTSRGAAALLASVIQQRLAAVTRTTATLTAAFDPRDGTLVLNAQIDPAAAAPTARAIEGELAALRASGPTAVELASARRRVLAHALAAEIGVSGRARQLEIAVATHNAPNDDSALTELRATTADELVEAARLLIDPATLQVTVRSPKQATDAVLRALGLDPKLADRR
jgi:predicted Zn-dependent peptidase